MFVRSVQLFTLFFSFNRSWCQWCVTILKSINSATGRLKGKIASWNVSPQSLSVVWKAEFAVPLKTRGTALLTCLCCSFSPASLHLLAAVLSLTCKVHVNIQSLCILCEFDLHDFVLMCIIRNPKFTTIHTRKWTLLVCVLCRYSSWWWRCRCVCPLLCCAASCCKIKSLWNIISKQSASELFLAMSG